jgi:hypothetical protein
MHFIFVSSRGIAERRGPWPLSTIIVSAGDSFQRNVRLQAEKKWSISDVHGFGLRALSDA